MSDGETAPADASYDANGRGAELYLDLLKRSLTGMLTNDPGAVPGEGTSSFEANRRLAGRDWPATAETMIGRARLDNIEACIRSVDRGGVRGDLIETGVWRGGATIFMRGVLEAIGDTSRAVWVADSFEGVPKPDPDAYPADSGDRLWSYPELAVSLDEVRASFASYGLLDERVRFLVGWFRDTLPHAPIERLAVLRLDGDLYESTAVALRSLYSKLEPGGYLIVDDYALDTCRAAVDEFRAENGIVDELRHIDWTGVYWRKSAG